MIRSQNPNEDKRPYSKYIVFGILYSKLPLLEDCYLHSLNSLPFQPFRTLNSLLLQQAILILFLMRSDMRLSLLSSNFNIFPFAGMSLQPLLDDPYSV